MASPYSPNVRYETPEMPHPPQTFWGGLWELVKAMPISMGRSDRGGVTQTSVGGLADVFTGKAGRQREEQDQFKRLQQVYQMHKMQRDEEGETPIGQRYPDAPKTLYPPAVGPTPTDVGRMSFQAAPAEVRPTQIPRPQDRNQYIRDLVGLLPSRALPDVYREAAERPFKEEQQRATEEFRRDTIAERRLERERRAREDEERDKRYHAGLTARSNDLQTRLQAAADLAKARGDAAAEKGALDRMTRLRQTQATVRSRRGGQQDQMRLTLKNDSLGLSGQSFQVSQQSYAQAKAAADQYIAQAPPDKRLDAAYAYAVAQQTPLGFYVADQVLKGVTKNDMPRVDQARGHQYQGTTPPPVVGPESMAPRGGDDLEDLINENEQYLQAHPSRSATAAPRAPAAQPTGTAQPHGAQAPLTSEVLTATIDDVYRELGITDLKPDDRRRVYDQVIARLKAQGYSDEQLKEITPP